MSAQFLTAPELAALPGIRHAYFTRQGGVSVGIYASLNGGVGSRDSREAVSENRARMCAALDVPAGHLVTPYQIHSPNAVIAAAPWSRDEQPRADAVVTATPGLAVAISTADCGPVLFADAKARVIAAAHAGWKGAHGGVLENTLARMEELGAQRDSIRAVLGPCIRQQSYEVGPDFTARFDEADALFFKPSDKNGHAMFDLAGYIIARLRKAGVAVIGDLGQDTYSDETRFFSYRRTTHRGEPDYGRLISAIALAHV